MIDHISAVRVADLGVKQPGKPSTEHEPSRRAVVFDVTAERGHPEHRLLDCRLLRQVVAPGRPCVTQRLALELRDHVSRLEFVSIAHAAYQITSAPRSLLRL